jgi:hypothetical protein
MSMSGDYRFEDALEIALRHARPEVFTDKQELILHHHLDCKIKSCRIASLTLGLDLHGEQTSRQHDSLNHSVFYVELENDGIARFSMENAESSKWGTESPGELIMKFHDFTGSSWKKIMFLQHLWLSEWILTLKHLVIFANIATLDQFIMLKDLVGCRCFV